METVTDFSYLDDRINTASGCEAAVTSRTRLRWAKFRECQDLLLLFLIHLKVKGIAYKSCDRSALLYGSEALYLGQIEIGTLLGTERDMVINICGVKLLDKKLRKDLMQMLDLE